MTRLRYLLLVLFGFALTHPALLEARRDACSSICDATVSCDEFCEDYGSCGNYGLCAGYCGDGNCNSAISEDYISCPEDCHYCGDGICEMQYESPCSCSADCGSCSGSGPECVWDSDCGVGSGLHCANGVCVAQAAECNSCDSNQVCCYEENYEQSSAHCCNFLYGCGDGICSPSIGENHANCPDDCSDQANFGDGICQYPAEDNYNDSLDCYCGDAVCDTWHEGNATCPSDCPQG